METYTSDSEGNLVIIPDMVQPPSETKTIEELQQDLEMAQIRLAECSADLQVAVDQAQKRLDAALSFLNK